MLYQYRLTGSNEILQAVVPMADYALGVNPLGRSFYSNLGARPPSNPLHLDSFPYDVASKGHVPGILIYGNIAGPSGNGFEKKVWGQSYPTWNALPPLRQFADG